MTSRRTPPGPAEKFDPSHDLLHWIEDQFKHYGNIYRASVFGTDVYVVTEPDYIDHVLRRNWQNYRKGFAIKRIGMLLGNGLMVSEGEFWKSQRQMIQPLFHDEAIRHFVRVIVEANVALLKQWQEAAARKEDVNITRDISRMVLKITLMAIFGDDYEQVASDLEMISDVAERNLQFADAFRPLRKLVLDLVLQRRQNDMKAADMLGMLMEARDRKSGAGMPNNLLVNEVMTLIVAGHETTASTLNWTWHLLSVNSQVEERLWSELSALSADTPGVADIPKLTYTRHVIEETMRLYPAGWLMTRRALKDDQFGDYFVPAGTEIYISPYLIQRHPAFWESPDHFNPDRFGPSQSQGRHPMTMLPFSAGPRKCIGESFARIEMQIHLMIVARHLRLRSTRTEPVPFEADVNLRSACDLIMTPELIHPGASIC